MGRSCLLIVLVASTAAMGVNIIPNGSFETPLATTDNGSWAGDRYMPNWDMGGWIVGGVGGVDLMRSFPAAHGDQCVNLNGGNWGVLRQFLPTTVGQQYILSFALSWNPGGSEMMEQVWVNFGYQNWGQFIDYAKGPTPTWTYYSFPVTAQANISEVCFESRVSGVYGPMLDDVSLTPVPEPA